mmetsp:Transcript_9914/g.21039  ORF Transcript_9914/g.21039 Transcript_9914/m.21039 type:complete len:353 (-) Transcript_9914:28-1086(-)
MTTSTVRRRAGSSKTDFGRIAVVNNDDDQGPFGDEKSNEEQSNGATSVPSPALTPSSSSSASTQSAALSTRSLRSSLSFKASSSLSVGCPEKYADKRSMTPFQEKINAVTILPSAILCIYYMVSGKWILPETVEMAMQALENSTSAQQFNLLSGGCINWALFPRLTYMPPPTILSISIGVLLHCPCSFIYHWFYAANPNPTERFKHWSRRLDHSAIHACSILWSYSISCGSVPFVVFNLAYNADCIRRHFEEEIKPRRNQLRIIGSMLLYTSPLLFMQDDDGSRLQLFRKVWGLFVVAVWFFAAYPVGGWSHAAFHIVMIGVPPLLLDMAAKMEADGDWSMAAAQCAVLKAE